MTPITAEAEAVSTVTVVTGTAPDRKWTATAIEITDEGALLVGDGEKDGVAEVFAIYAPGHWASAALDEHRAEAGHGGATAAGLEAILGEIEKAAREGEGSDWERVTDVRAILGRYRKAGRQTATETP